MRHRTWFVVGLVVCVCLGVAIAAVLLGRGGPTPAERATADDVARPTTSGRPTTSSSTSTPSDPAATTPVIETTRDFYFGRPDETIAIDGRYLHAPDAARLRLQVRRPDGWQTFPLPAVPRPSGVFRAYVELGVGQYRLRLVDPDTGTTSKAFTLLLF
jgi:hypothetical protein